ncbi:16S rRNA (cytidine(1402)-2'-O)-methyltransferase [Ureaplasma miroungigenitalium]|uniref:Ribosomal RNA small subunit methyltransferase I n=1 Tax=Ureaplasma miroungigenitalium TaxID=1042321 RepID=A0ABT3BN41_9BACT|nr:16S rRNA (cytidine(1402)-2'-O)-methyltransferase [Ureaplasma miroungigenitalium]MCV3728649.1 16S rRNA (cytidine(1402)-2'-O)-methyltransferase [Ureaplasma miroungigenitalium]
MFLKDFKCQLSVIATPIGNLKEMNQRAINALNEAYVILCEDTRITKKLLHAFNIIDYKKLIRFDNFKEQVKIDEALEYIKNYKTVLVSDAGYPTVADPGYNLINACHANNIGVEVINGPSACMHALVASGLLSSTFMFLGFLGKTQKQRLDVLKKYANVQTTFVVYEAVHRIKKTLADLHTVFGDVNVFIGRELTKLNESFYFGKISTIADQITELGEFVIVIDNNEQQTQLKQEEDSEIIVKNILDLTRDGMRLKDACKQVAKAYELNASELYKIMLNYA